MISNAIKVNNLTKEQIASVNNALAIFNKGKDIDCPTYAINVTGEKSAYFTLWIKKKHRWIYMQNLSLELETSLNKAKDIASERNGKLIVGDLRNITYDYGKLTMVIGKYKGQLIKEVATKDLEYLRFVVRTMLDDIPTNEQNVYHKTTLRCLKAIKNLIENPELFELAKGNYIAPINTTIDTTFEVIASGIDTKRNNLLFLCLKDNKGNLAKCSIYPTKRDKEGNEINNYLYRVYRKGEIIKPYFCKVIAHTISNNLKVTLIRIY